MRKVAVMGVGNVGSTVAHLIVDHADADELVLFDARKERLKAEVLDLQDAASLLDRHVTVSEGSFKEMADADVIISAIGRIDLIEPGGDRFTELRANKPSAEQLGKDLKAAGFKGVLIAITNPVDVITGIYQANLGLPANQVIGTGTYLDTARMKRVVAEKVNLDPRSIEGYVLGEHGDSQFVAWSTVRALGKSAEQLAEEFNFSLDDAEQAARQGGFDVFAGKHYTNVAIAHAAVSLMNLVLSDARRESIVSHYDKDLDSYISTPAVIGRQGIVADIDLDLPDSEYAKLKASAQTISEKTQANS
ncbi:lactate/malate family dehydrogenase [Eupransor demetentiae]|uniref:Malate/lactate dehydrogenase (Mdh) n=1 Tax=Eupransor demetentiae TaxID=3109584 RepID=A0ABM9N569_9LACO|nr:Malate/lactate dehydrogenase (Mdh) [Lactobacillaceae bacterium LMG 33000]